RSGGPKTPMACQDDDCEAPAGYSDRELPPLIVDTRTRCHRGRFHVRQLDHPQQTLPNADQWPSECSALPLATSFSVYMFITLSFVDIYREYDQRQLLGASAESR